MSFFFDVRLSERVARGFQGGPEWNTTEIELANGQVDFQAEWDYPRHKYVADYKTFTEQGRAAILEQHWVARGKWGTFPFKDWNDYKAVNQVMGVGNGLSTPMRLVKRYQKGPEEAPVVYVRPLRLIVVGTGFVFEDGEPKEVVIDRLTGMATPAAPWTPGAVITGTCEFDVKVRFGKDHYAFTRVGGEATTVSIDLVEDKRWP